jgi:hypothetical protein
LIPRCQVLCFDGRAILHHTLPPPQNHSPSITHYHPYHYASVGSRPS